MSDRFAAFKHASYQRYFGARFLSSFASYILTVAVGFHLYDITGDPFLLGLIGLVLFAPALLLVMFTGLASDRLGRRTVMGASVALMGVCAAVIMAMALTGTFQPTFVLIALGLLGVGRAFYSPAASSLAVNVVPQKDFANAVSWNATTWQSAGIAGPAIGGVLQAFSSALAYGVAAAMFIAAALIVLTIPRTSQVRSTERTSFTALLGGFRYVWKEKMVLGAISLDLFAVLLGGTVALLPVYAKDILEIGEIGNGLLRAAPGIGALITIGLITAFPIRRHAGLILFASVAAFGVFTAVFGHSKVAWLSIVTLMLVGGFDMVSVYIREVIMQMWTPDNVRGRVNAVNSIFLGASNELGDFRAGAMAASLGTVFTMVAGGYAAVAVSGLWSAMFLGLRKVDSLERDKE